MDKRDLLFLLSAISLFALAVYAKNSYVERNKNNKRVQLIFQILLPIIALTYFTYRAITKDNFYWIIVAIGWYYIVKEIRKWRNKTWDNSND